MKDDALSLHHQAPKPDFLALAMGTPALTANQFDWHIQIELEPNPIRGPSRCLVDFGQGQTGPIPQRKRSADNCISCRNFSCCLIEWNQFSAGQHRRQFFWGNCRVVAPHPGQNFAPVHRADGNLNIRSSFEGMKKSFDPFSAWFTLNHCQNGCGIQNDSIHVRLPRTSLPKIRPESRQDFRAPE